MDDVEKKHEKYDWWPGYRDSWSSGWAIAGSAWLLGRFASKNEYQLAWRSKTARERAEHLDQAATFNLASNIGAGFFVYEWWKKHPKLTSVSVFAYFGLSALVSYMSLPNRWNKARDVPPLPAPPSVATGWEPWEHWKPWERREHYGRW